MMTYNIPTRVLAAAAALALLILVVAGCGGAGASVTGSGAGTLAVHIANATVPSAPAVEPPLPTGVTAVNVIVSRVDANVNGQWQILATPNSSFNLLDLTQHDALLAQAPLPAGFYSQVRFVISSASVVDASGTHDCTIPSGMQTGVKVNVDFSIAPNVITDVLLNIDVAKSLHVTGNGTYMFDPVCSGTLVTLSGTISGTVTSGGNPAAGATVTATYAAGTNYPIGTVVNSAVTQSDGTFQVQALLPGTYNLNFAYTIPNTTTTQTAYVTGAVVVAQQDTNVGSVALVTTGSVSGTILSGGNPASGATVTATYTAGTNFAIGGAAGTTTSAGNGTFSLMNLPPGTYTVNVTFISGTTQTGSVTSVVVVSGVDTPIGSVTVA